MNLTAARTHFWLYKNIQKSRDAGRTNFAKNIAQTFPLNHTPQKNDLSTKISVRPLSVKE